MQISKQERREKLLLFNVAEAARMLGIGVNKFHMDLIGGYLPKPQVQIGKRRYYKLREIEGLAARLNKEIKH